MPDAMFVGAASLPFQYGRFEHNGNGLKEKELIAYVEVCLTSCGGGQKSHEVPIHLNVRLQRNIHTCATIQEVYTEFYLRILFN